MSASTTNRNNKDYISEIDQLITEFDARHPTKSPSQLYEINKYARIAKLRDGIEREHKEQEIWENF